MNPEPVIVEVEVGFQGPKGAPGNAGAPYQWVVGDEAARLAITPENADLHKLCIQLDTGQTWRLAATDPPAWTGIVQEPFTQTIDCGTFF